MGFSPRSLPAEERRQYVTVETVTVHEPGARSWVEPVAVRWYDGRRWEIESIFGHEVVGVENDNEVVRWRVMISGQPKYVYQGKDWFVVPKAPKVRLP